jgi:hypothetical protein
MVLALPVVVGILLGLLARGDLRRLANLDFRRIELFYAAVGAQILAFPFSFLPWHTSDGAARTLWLASYGLLVCAAVINRHVTGVPVVAAGMVANIVAVIANGGHMPALPRALHAAGLSLRTHYNSAAVATPHLSWLVDRWAVPRDLGVGNVFSVGDVVIAIGAVVLVVSAMGAKLPALPRRSQPPQTVR